MFLQSILLETPMPEVDGDERQLHEHHLEGVGECEVGVGRVPLGGCTTHQPPPAERRAQ